jgi:hypothetical protein
MPKLHSYELSRALKAKKEADFFHARIFLNCSRQQYDGSRRRWRATQLRVHHPHPTATMLLRFFESSGD